MLNSLGMCFDPMSYRDISQYLLKQPDTMKFLPAETYSKVPLKITEECLLLSFFPSLDCLSAIVPSTQHLNLWVIFPKMPNGRKKSCRRCEQVFRYDYRYPREYCERCWEEERICRACQKVFVLKPAVSFNFRRKYCDRCSNHKQVIPKRRLCSDCGKYFDLDGNFIDQRYCDRCDTAEKERARKLWIQDEKKRLQPRAEETSNSPEQRVSKSLYYSHLSTLQSPVYHEAQASSEPERYGPTSQALYLVQSQHMNSLEGCQLPETFMQASGFTVGSYGYPPQWSDSQKPPFNYMEQPLSGNPGNISAKAYPSWSHSIYPPEKAMPPNQSFIKYDKEDHPEDYQDSTDKRMTRGDKVPRLQKEDVGKEPCLNESQRSNAYRSNAAEPYYPCMHADCEAGYDNEGELKIHMDYWHRSGAASLHTQSM